MNLLINRVSESAVSKIEGKREWITSRVTLVLSLGGAAVIAALISLLSWGASMLEDNILVKAEKAAQVIATTESERLREETEQALSQAKKDADDQQERLQQNVEKQQQVFRDELQRELASLRADTDQVTRSVANDVSLKAVDAKLEGIEDQIDFFQTSIQLAGLANRLEVSTGFTDREARDAIDLINTIGLSEKRDSTVEFRTFVEKVIDSFAAAGRNDFIARLEENHSDLMLSEQGIVITMLQALGQELIGFDGDPTIQTDSVFQNGWDQALKRFQSYVVASRKVNVREIAFPYQAVVMQMLGEDRAAITAHVKSISRLAPGELGAIENIFGSFLTENWKNEPDAETALVRDRALAFLRDYAAEDSTGTLLALLEGSPTPVDLDGLPLLPPELLSLPPEVLRDLLKSDGLPDEMIDQILQQQPETSPAD